MVRLLVWEVLPECIRQPAGPRPSLLDGLRQGHGRTLNQVVAVPNFVVPKETLADVHLVCKELPNILPSCHLKAQD